MVLQRYDSSSKVNRIFKHICRQEDTKRPSLYGVKFTPKMNGEQQWEKSVRVPQNLLLTGGKETAVTKHSNAPRYQRAPRAQCGTQATRGSWELGYGRTARRSSAQHLQLGEDL